MPPRRALTIPEIEALVQEVISCWNSSYDIDAFAILAMERVNATERASPIFTSQPYRRPFNFQTGRRDDEANLNCSSGRAPTRDRRYRILFKRLWNSSVINGDERTKARMVNFVRGLLLDYHLYNRNRNHNNNQVL